MADFDWLTGLAFGAVPGFLNAKKKSAPQSAGAPFQSGIRPYDPSLGLTPPPQNYWQGNQFMMPSQSELLQRFPELAKIMGGGQAPMPQTQPGMMDRLKNSGAFGSISPGVGLKGAGGVLQKKLFGLFD